MLEFTTEIQQEFQRNANQEIAIAQSKYLKNKFVFYGIKTPLRRDLQKSFLMVKHLPPKEELAKIVKILWLKPQRELHYFTQELVRKYLKHFSKDDGELFEFMMVHNSWWDSIDFIAVNLVGSYFEMYPNQKDIYIKKWMDSDNIWLQRTCLLFQLKYKQQLNTELLSRLIQQLLGSKEFFINKAIGWILREYSKVNPKWVLDFVSKIALSNLSRREAIRFIKIS